MVSIGAPPVAANATAPQGTNKNDERRVRPPGREVTLDQAAYRLEFDRPRARASTPDTEAGQAPSRLLDPYAEAVPYRRRSAEERQLRAWRDSADEPGSLVLAQGPGGSGKTRLAGRFAAESRREGWAVAWAVEKTAGGDGHHDRGRGVDGHRLLVVVDQADRWRLRTLVSMIGNLRVEYPHQGLRVLLLARPHPTWWEAAAAELRRLGLSCHGPVDMEDFAVGAQARQQAFRDAAAAFAERVGAAPKRLPVPTDLEHDGYASPVLLHMAALAAVLGDQEGRRGLPEQAQLTGYLWGHEERYWTTAMGGGLPNEVMRRTAFLAALCGPIATGATAAALLRRTGLTKGNADARSILDVFSQLYPPSGAAGEPAGSDDEALTPLATHRLSEDFVSNFVAGSDGSDMVRTLLANAQTDPDDSILRQCLAVLSATAVRNEPARTALFTALRREPQLAAHATAALVEVVIAHAPYELAASIDAVLPRFSVDLSRAARDLARHLNDTIPRDAPADQRALRQDRLSVRLADVGDMPAALGLARSAVDIYRPLAEKDPAGYLSALASALNNVAVFGSDAGDPRTAVEHSQEVVAIRRRLADANPDLHLRHLATALNNLVTHLATAGERKAALEPAQEAVAVHRRLVERDPVGFLPELAGALSHLAARFADVGDNRAALAPAREAVDIYGRLTEIEPARYLPALASALSDLSVRFSSAGDRRASVEPSREAVTIYRRLADAEPGRYLRDVASALKNNGMRLAGVGEDAAAQQSSREAVDLYRRLAEAQPGMHLAELASALSNLGVQVAGVDRQAALALAREAVDAYRRVGELEPGTRLAGLASALTSLAARSAEAGDNQTAFQCAEEAATSYRRLAEAEPAIHLAALAAALENLGTRASAIGDRRLAIRSGDEAVTIYRRLAGGDPTGHLPGLAVALVSLGSHLFAAGDKRAALPTGEAVPIYRRLADDDPGTYLPGLASVLDNYGAHLIAAGDKRAALEPARESVTIYRRLAKSDPAAYLPGLASALDNLGAHLIAAGDKRAALEPTREAADVYRKLVRSPVASPATPAPPPVVATDATLDELRSTTAKIEPVADSLVRRLDEVLSALRGVAGGAVTRLGEAERLAAAATERATTAESEAARGARALRLAEEAASRTDAIRREAEERIQRALSKAADAERVRGLAEESASAAAQSIADEARRREVADRHAAAAAAHAGQLAEELAAANRRLDTQKVETEELRRTNENLTSERTDATHRLQAMETKLSALTQDLDAERRTVATLRERAEESNSAIAVALTTAEAASARAQAAEDRLGQLLAGITNLAGERGQR